MIDIEHPDDPTQPVSKLLYQIRLRGLLQQRWHAWFDGMTVTLDQERGETVLTGVLRDQPALHGVLARIRDLNLTLLSVVRQESSSHSLKE